MPRMPLAACLAVPLLLAACGDPTRAAAVEDCVERGRAYFIAIESFPRLRSTGEDAMTVARERCNRMPATAF